MRKIFTFSFITIALSVFAFNGFGQACTGTSFTPVQTYAFGTVAGGTQGFTQSFTRVNAGGGHLSADVGAISPTTKVLISPTFMAPNSAGNVLFTFDLGGNASVTGYAIDFLYNNAGTITPMPVCSANTTLSGGTYFFSVQIPTQILGQRFQIRITFNVSGNNNNTVTIDNYGTNVVESQIVLPVRFTSLDAKTTNNSVSLKWVVGSEDNVTGYEIEKSADGRSFSKIGFIGSAGQSSYSFVDTKPSSVSYYRIKSVDADGRYTYSTVALVKAGKSMIVLKAFPSPFVNSLSIQHATATTGSLIKISSEDGRLIKSVAPLAGTQQTDIDLSTAKPGLYLISFRNGSGEVETLKILKQQ